MPKPNHVFIGLWIFWSALVLSISVGLYPELRYIYDQMEAQKGENPFQANTWLGVGLAVPFLLLTPKFIGSTIAAIALVFVARRKAWSRWALLLGVLVTGVALLGGLGSTPTSGDSSISFWSFTLRAVTYLAMATAVTLFFSSQASAWFRAARTHKEEASQHDVA